MGLMLAMAILREGDFGAREARAVLGFVSVVGLAASAGGGCPTDYACASR